MKMSPLGLVRAGRLFARASASGLLGLCLFASPVVGQEPSPLGVNLSSAPYYGNNYLFKNRMKSASKWMNNWDENVDQSLVQPDANGYPTVKPAGWDLTTKINTGGKEGQQTQIIVTYEGNGSVSLDGPAFSLVSSDTTSNPRRMVYNFNGNNNPFSRLRISTTAAAPNHVRNIGIHFAGEEPGGTNYNPWTPQVMSRLAGYKVLRFMDWGKTNNSRPFSWAERAQPSFYTYDNFPRGMPIEMMVDLCNRLGADMWFCVPHEADQTYVQNAAALIKSQLNPGLKVYIEWSNEVWNAQFLQWRYAASIVGQRHGVNVPYPNPGTSAQEDAWKAAFSQNQNQLWDEMDRVYGEFSGRTFKWFQDGWGSGWQTRVVRVLATQMGSTPRMARSIEGVNRVAGTGFDRMAVGAYFCHNVHEWFYSSGAYLNRNEAGYAPAFERIMNTIRSGDRAQIQAVGEWCQQNNVTLIAYEGGQHIAPNLGFTDPVTGQWRLYNEVPGLPEFIEDINRDPRMFDAYEVYFDYWSKAGGQLMMAYHDVGGNGRYGVWGHIEYDGQPVGRAPGQAVKKAALIDWALRQSGFAITNLADLPNGGTGYFYSEQLRAVRGTAPYTFTVLSGSLPPGLSLNTSTGLLSGVPTVQGLYTFTIRVTDAANPQKQYEKQFRLRVNAQPDPIRVGIVQDSNVQSWNPNLSFGGDSTLWASGGYEPGNGSISYLRANLGAAVQAIAGRPVASVKLRIYMKDSFTGTARSVIARVLPNESLNLDAVTWNTRPTLGEQIGSASIPSGPAWVEIDITSHALQKAAGSQILSLALVSPDSTQWLSRESSTPPTVEFVLAPHNGVDPLTITTSSLAGGTVGTAYSATLAATGGSGSKTWSLASGTLPAGLTLSSGGVISGTPTAAGTSNFTVRVTDSSGNTTRALSIAIAAGGGGGGSVTISNVVLSTGATAQVGSSLATGKVVYTDRSYTWNNVGTLAGNPYLVLPNNDKNNTQSNYLSFTISGPATVYVAYDVRATTLPGWLSGFTAAGQTWTVNGDVNRTLYRRDYPAGTVVLGGNKASPGAGMDTNYSVIVVGTAPAETVATPTFSPAGGTYTSAQSVSISTTTSGATIRYTSDGSDPTPSSGTVYSGPVSVSASQTLKAIAYKSGATDSGVASASYTIVAPLSVTTSSLAGGTVGTAYSATLAASGGSGTKSWTVASGSLPAGLTLSSGGEISGTPTAAGTANFTVRVSDPTGQAERALSIAVTGGGGGGGSSFEVGTGGFSATAAGGIQANLNASFSSGRLVLTPAVGNQRGSAFRTGKVGITQFWTEFTFQVSQGSGNPADGFTFALQNASTTAVGSAGGDLGYRGSGISGAKAAVRFEFYNQPSTGLYTGDALLEQPLPQPAFDFENAAVYRARISYGAGVLKVAIRNTATGTEQETVFGVNLPEVLGATEAWAGFTGGTGGEHARQEILTWSFGQGAAPWAGGSGGTAGAITREYWTNVWGSAVSNLTSHANYPNNPTGVDTLSELRAVNWANPSQTSNWGDGYGQRIRGFLVAPATGAYTFWVSGDDQVELWLSTNNSPDNKVRIAHHTGWTNALEWNKYATQKSAAISLVAGQRYYIEVLHKEDSGGDNLAVGWARPGQATSSPSEIVPGTVLETWSEAGALPPPPQLTISNVTLSTAGQAQLDSDLQVGKAVFSDRTFTYANVGPHAGKNYLRLPNNDKTNNQANYLNFTVNVPVTVHVAWDSRIATVPGWLSSFELVSGQTMLTAGDTGTNGNNRVVYRKNFPAGTITLGGPGGTSSSNNYSVIIQAQ